MTDQDKRIAELEELLDGTQGSQNWASNVLARNRTIVELREQVRVLREAMAGALLFNLSGRADKKLREALAATEPKA